MPPLEQEPSLAEKIKSASNLARNKIHDTAIEILGRKKKKFEITGERKKFEITNETHDNSLEKKSAIANTSMPHQGNPIIDAFQQSGERMQSPKNTSGRQKFTVRGTPKKKFNITSDTIKNEDTHMNKQPIKLSHEDRVIRMNFDGREIEWAQQKDANSCGYCLLKNLSNYIDIEAEGNIKNLYQAIIEQSRRKQPEDGSDRRWATDGELTDYIRESSNEKYQSIPVIGESELSVAINRIRNNNFAFTLMIRGRHFTGIVPKGNGQYYLLDSMINSPQIINLETAIQYTKDASKESLIIGALRS